MRGGDEGAGGDQGQHPQDDACPAASPPAAVTGASSMQARNVSTSRSARCISPSLHITPSDSPRARV